MSESTGARAAVEPTTVRPPTLGPDDEPDTGTQVESESETETRLGFPWNVIVWDDPVNLMSYVVYVFQKLFGFSREKATKHMLEVHNQGRSVLVTVEREQGEFYVTRLHAYGLQATLERSSES
jgi:ATP-dependent Clp protease adaptor protein ClpS